MNLGDPGQVHTMAARLGVSLARAPLALNWRQATLQATPCDPSPEATIPFEQTELDTTRFHVFFGGTSRYTWVCCLPNSYRSPLRCTTSSRHRARETRLRLAETPPLLSVRGQLEVMRAESTLVSGKIHTNVRSQVNKSEAPTC